MNLKLFLLVFVLLVPLALCSENADDQVSAYIRTRKYLSQNDPAARGPRKRVVFENQLPSGTNYVQAQPDEELSFNPRRRHREVGPNSAYMRLHEHTTVPLREPPGAYLTTAPYGWIAPVVRSCFLLVAVCACALMIGKFLLTWSFSKEHDAKETVEPNSSG